MKHKRRIGEHVVIVSTAEDLAPLAEDLLDTLERLDARGPKLRDGFKIGYGWVMLTLEEGLTEDDSLDVLEPNLFTNPLEHTKSTVHETFDVLLEQGRACKLVHAEPIAAWYTHDVQLAPGVLDEDKVYLLRRPPTSDHDTGWYIGSVVEPEGPKAEELETLPVWRIFQKRRELLDAMALPFGYMAVVVGTYIDAILDPSNKEVYRR